MKKFILATVLLLAAAPAQAMKPCGPDTWFANKDRPAAEWQAEAAVVFTGTVTARDERIAPYPNCSMDDKSQCTMQDSSVITVKITAVEKGDASGLKEIQLKPGFCAPPPPKETGGTYRFYLNTADLKTVDSVPVPYLFFAPATE